MGARTAGLGLKAGFDPTPEGHPDVRTALERYHEIMLAIRRMPKRMRSRSTCSTR